MVAVVSFCCTRFKNELTFSVILDEFCILFTLVPSLTKQQINKLFYDSIVVVDINDGFGNGDGKYDVHSESRATPFYFCNNFLKLSVILIFFGTLVL